MSKSVFVGIDAGTSSLKIAVFDSMGVLLTEDRQKYKSLQTSTGINELSPLSVYEALEESFRAIEWSDYILEGICVASFGEAFVTIDKYGRELGEIVMYADSRCIDQAIELERTIGSHNIYSENGCGVASLYSLPKLMWIKKVQPERYNTTVKILPVADYIVYKLSGIQIASISLAARTMAFSIQKQTWSRTILSAAKIRPEIFPDIAELGSPVASLKAKFLKRFGIRGDAKIFAGGHDQIFAAIGTGLSDRKKIVDGMGSVECLIAMLPEHPDYEIMRKHSLVSIPYLPGTNPITYAYSLSGGSLLHWFGSEIYFGTQNNISQEAMNEMLSMMAEDSSGVIVVPHLNGSGTPDLDPEMKAAFIGMQSFSTKDHLTRALVEGMNYEILLNLNNLREIGVIPEKIYVTGGGTESNILLQLKADMLSLPVIRSKNLNGGVLGAGIVTATAAGFFSSVQEGMKKWIKTGSEFESGYSEDQEKQVSDFLQYIKLRKLLKAYWRESK